MQKLCKVKVVTGPVRFDGVNIFIPIAHSGDSRPRYSLTLLIPKTDQKTLESFKKAFNEVITLNPKIFTSSSQLEGDNLLIDGDLCGNGNYANSFVLVATTHEKPGVVDIDLNPIIYADEIHSGCLGRASITLTPYRGSGGWSIASELNNVQKLDDGELIAVSES